MVDRALLAAFVEFLATVWRPAAAVVGVAAVTGVGAGLVALGIAGDATPRLRRLRTARVLPWTLAGALLAGLLAALLHRPLPELVVAAAIGAGLGALGWGLGRSLAWPGPDPPDWLGRLAVQLAGVGALVGAYFAYIGFRVHRTITAGLGPTALGAVEPDATVFAAVAVLPLYGLLGLAIALLLGLAWFWETAGAWLEAAIAERSPATTERLEGAAVRADPGPLRTVGGLAAVAGALAWIVLSPRPDDIVVALVGGLSLVLVVLIFEAVRTIRGLEAEQVPDAAIERELALQGGEIAVYAFSIGGALVAGAAVADLLTGAFYQAVLTPAASLFAPEAAELLRLGPASPADVRSYFAFYAGEPTFLTLAVSLVKLLLPVVVLVFGVPYAVEYLAFRGVRSIVVAVATLVGVLGLHVIIELVVSGEITHLSALGLTSLLPTLSAGLSGSVVEWLTEEVGHAHCPSCDRRVERSANYCDHCGARLVTCPDCGAFSAIVEGACANCGSPVEEPV